MSLALFALISMAGIALVDSVVRVEEGTSGRLDRLGELQRAMFILTRDFEQLSAGSLRQADGGVQFLRNAPSIYDEPQAIRYALRGNALYRKVGATEGPAQLLIAGVGSADWSFFFKGAGWRNDLPVNEAGEAEQPAAVAANILVEGIGPAGPLRRVVELPTPPPPPPQPILLP